MSWTSMTDHSTPELPEVDYHKGYERRRVYNISVSVDAYTREEAFDALKEAVREITEEMITDCSSHPTEGFYIPYVGYSCYWRMAAEG